MSAPGIIRKLDEVVVNRIAAGEVVQRPANALKELIENSLDAKANNIQINVKEGGLKLLQIQDNGTGIRKEDMDIVCERFTTSKLQNFDDLRSISTFGFRGEALASISHIALLTIITKTADEKCAYKASYVDSKIKAPPKPCAGNQGTTIMIENLFYNVATRRKALSNPSEEFSKITEVVMKYAVHNPSVGFALKKHGDITPQVRTPHNSTKINNVKIIYGNPVSRELLEVELNDEAYKFKMHGLITNPNYNSKRIVILLFINNRLVESSSIRRMLEDLYSVYLPKKAHPWCYISLDINPQNIDVNVHPTKHEVRFLHEDAIIERVKDALDEKLAGNSASRTFYVQARLPKADITKDALKEVLPEYEKDAADKSKKLHPREMIRTDSSIQKLDKFDFTINNAKKHSRVSNINHSNKTIDNDTDLEKSKNVDLNPEVELMEETKTCGYTQRERIVDYTDDNVNIVNTRQVETIHIEKIEENKNTTPWSDLANDSTPTSSSFTPSDDCIVTSTQKEVVENIRESTTIDDILQSIRNEFPENDAEESASEDCVDMIADKARKRVYQYFGTQSSTASDKQVDKKPIENTIKIEEENTKEAGSHDKSKENKAGSSQLASQPDAIANKDEKSSPEFKSYSVNKFRREVNLTSVLRLRKEVEDDCHEGLREILSDLTFVGCIDETSALVQSGVNLYLCDTKTLAEELFYEIMLYDFANYGVIKFSDPLPLYDLAMLGLDSEEAGWSEEDGDKGELATNVKELLLEKADMMTEYFSVLVDKKGNLKSLPILLDKYFPFEGGLPLYILRLSTEVDWLSEQSCFQNICRETAKYYSIMNPVHNTHDWKYITEHVLYPAIKESLLPPKHFAHDSTILKIASLPDLYKVFERC